MVDHYDMEDIEVHGKGGTRSRTNRTDLSQDADRVDLARVGKQQVLKRRFGFMSMIGFSCTLMGTWAGLLTYFAGPLTNGGYAGSAYGFLFAWGGVMCVMCSLAELASMAPTSGGQVWTSPLCQSLNVSSLKISSFNISHSIITLPCWRRRVVRRSSVISRDGQP